MLCPEESLRPASVIESKRRKHSEKPDKVYEIIEKMYPPLKKNRTVFEKGKERVEKVKKLGSISGKRTNGFCFY